MKRLYAIGPVTGIESDNLPAFERASWELRRAGYEVDIPHQFIKSRTPHEEAMRISIRFLTAAKDGFVEKGSKLVRVRNAPYYDGVAMLPDWEDSPGAVIEKQVAEACGIPCKTVDDWLNPPKEREQQAAAIWKPKSNRGRKRRAVIRSDGKRYESILEAAIDVAGDKKGSAGISSACKGRAKTAYGYGWRYEEDVRE